MAEASFCGCELTRFWQYNCWSLFVYQAWVLVN